jgi:hypothetical protein
MDGPDNERIKTNPKVREELALIGQNDYDGQWKGIVRISFGLGWQAIQAAP